MKEYIVDECKKLKIDIPNNVQIDIKEFKDIYRNKDHRYEIIKKIVEEKGGKLLTDVYVGCSHKFDVDCGKGHIWPTCYSYLKNGSWCPKCNKFFKIKDLRKYAKSKGGKCFNSKTHISLYTKLKWKCKKEHIWCDSVENVLNGQWCDECDK